MHTQKEAYILGTGTHNTESHLAVHCHKNVAFMAFETYMLKYVIYLKNGKHSNLIVAVINL
jgi:hypothetical protein